VAMRKLSAVVLALSLLPGASGAKLLCDLRCSQRPTHTHHHADVPPTHSTHHHSMEGQTVAVVLRQGETDSAWVDRSACREYAVAISLTEKSRLSVTSAVALLAPSVEVQPVVPKKSRSTIFKSPPYAFFFHVTDVALRI
jgi:hypothetical protein